MSDEGTGASGTGAGGQQGGDTTTSSTTSTAARPGTGSANSNDGFDASVWKTFAEETGLTVEQAKKKLEHARTWEDRAKNNSKAVEELGSLKGDFEKMQQQLSQRDERDQQRAGNLAMSDVRSQLAELGVKASDVKELLDEYEPKRLLKDGEPDDEAIERLVKALAKAAGRPAPDNDQGQKGDDAPPDMNRLIRRAAGRG